MMDAARGADRDRGRHGREAGGASRPSPSTTSPSAARQVVNDAMDILGGKGICMGPVELPRRRATAAAGGDHRRGRQHPDPQPDHLRPGRDPLPPVRAEGDAGAAREADRAKASRRLRRRAVRPHPLRARQLRAHASCMGLTGSHFVARAARTSRRETRRYYQQLTRFSAAFAFLADVSMGVLGGGAEAQGEALGAAGRHPVAAVPVLGDAEALRGRGPPDGRRAAAALGDVGRDVQGAERASRACSRTSPTASSPWCCAGSCSRSAGRTWCRPTSWATRWRELLIEPSADARPADRRHRSSRKAADDPVALIELALDATLAAEPIEAKIRAAHEGPAARRQAAAGRGRRRAGRACAGQGIDHRGRRRRRCSPPATLTAQGDPGRRLPAGPRHLGAATARLQQSRGNGGVELGAGPQGRRVADGTAAPPPFHAVTARAARSPRWRPDARKTP